MLSVEDVAVDEIVLTVLSDGTVQADGPGAAEFLSTLNAWFKLKGIVAPEDVADEIQRLAPSARRVATQ
jgi:hypothetical protein